MKRIVNFSSFNVFSIEKEVWDIEYHNHNFYELIVVESGKGTHHLNGLTFMYKKGDVFLLRPSDAHEFSIKNKTKFIYIKFTEQQLWEKLQTDKKSELSNVIQLLMEDRSFVYESAIRNKADQEHLLQLAKILLHEFSNKSYYSRETSADLFSAIMTIVIRNAMNNGGMERISQGLNQTEKILYYINVHAMDPDKMKLEYLAREFMLSPNYISIYIKKQTGFSVQQHVMQQKMKAAERLLKQSNYNINEIADQLGFNDASHFNKIFRAHKSKSPSAFRKED
ncbi:helix-turn-helix domain-containing protein [Chryseobacterium carnipullorum]|uniref:Helix-turn-helix domain-containing protein n=1 Tax=Chryseobacterium carnipullorum TaxID=1124835 RepID=A0A3G6NJ46_CHRCU|nr:helix-turn-helix domain-containing protein [Chryseobacterium carnipullorum]AZA50127.1 helix-turn-helix domain-containing protein [Chryseobacterium carnipullorum]AZA65003.1 helix-turn-helix domain-containing protein [Chryseobacterium carnipullorum]